MQLATGRASSRTVSIATFACGVVAAAVFTAGTAAAIVAGFTDVPDDHPHAAGIEYLAGTGITGGCDEGRFCPDDPVTRGQMATFIRRLSGADPAVQPSVEAATLAGYQIVQRDDTLDGAEPTLNGAPLLCPDGTRAVGGGATLSTFEGAINQSAPLADGSGWDVDVVRVSGTDDIDVTVHVICLPV